jgi:glycosyltransferase involved in cell wall biosynthesis
MDKTEGHIVFLTPGFPENEQDSTTIPALQVYLKTLRKTLTDICMTVITFQFPFSKKSYDWNGIQVIPLNGKNNRLKKLLIWNRALIKLQELNKKKKITVLHSFWISEASFIAQKFAKKYGIRNIVTVMGQDALRRNFYSKYLINSNCKIVSLSQNQHDLILKKLKLKSQIIPWILDHESFPELLNTKINILAVGSLIKLKNYPKFIEIILVLVKEFPNLKVQIIGGGNQEPSLRNTISQKKLDNNIVLTGKLSRKKVYQKMSQSGILLHTSLYESFGYVFAEALYSGMHVVSFNVGIAKSFPSWKVCSNDTEMINHLSYLINENQIERKRFLLNKKEDTLNPYLKLYHT